MKKFAAIVALTAGLIVGFVPTAEARRVEAASAAEIKKVQLSAGDTLVLKAGEWRDQVVKIHAVGTEQAPIHIVAEEKGQTVFTGASKFGFSGEWIVVSGLWFKDIAGIKGEVVAMRTSSEQEAYNCTLRDCAITAIGAPMDPTDFKWVSLYGSGNTVEGCSLLDKANMGTTLVVWFREGVVPAHTIRNNYFTRPRSLLGEDGGSKNGQETIRIGTSHFSMQDGGCLVEGNYFYECNGEVEIISNKSCRNTYRGNVFRECLGTLTLRHGDYCTVEGNVFDGAGKSGGGGLYEGIATSTGGIRLIGVGHKVYNNLLMNLTGRGYYAAISLIQGEPDSALNGYFAADHCLVAHNTIYNCQMGFNINHTGKRNKLAIKDNDIVNNVVVNLSEDKKVENVKVGLKPEPPTDMRYGGNVLWGGKVKGLTAEEFGAEDVNPLVREVKGVVGPLKKSFLDKNRVAAVEGIDKDLLGQPRGAQTTSGAVEVMGKLKVDLPSAKNCGVSWKIK